MQHSTCGCNSNVRASRVRAQGCSAVRCCTVRMPCRGRPGRACEPWPAGAGRSQGGCRVVRDPKKKSELRVSTLPTSDHLDGRGPVGGVSGLLGCHALRANGDDTIEAILDVQIVGFAHCDVSERPLRYDTCPPCGVTEGNRELASGQVSFRNGRSRRSGCANPRCRTRDRDDS